MRTGTMDMSGQSSPNGAPEHHDHHHAKPWRVAEKVEDYMGLVMTVAAAVLLAAVVFGVMHSGGGQIIHLQ